MPGIKTKSNAIENAVNKLRVSAGYPVLDFGLIKHLQSTPKLIKGNNSLHHYCNIYRPLKL